MLIQGIVSSPAVTLPDTSSPVGAILGKSGELLVSEINGQYYNQNYRGNVFIASNIFSGGAFPIYTTTAPVFFLWNPAGSGKNLVPIRFRAQYCTGTTVVFSPMWLYLQNAGGGNINSVVTANVPIVSPSLASASLNNANLANGVKNVGLFSVAPTIVTTSSFFLRNMGFSVGPVITTSVEIAPIIDDFNGEVIVPPGQAIYPAANVASVGLFNQSLSWYEVPI